VHHASHPQLCQSTPEQAIRSGQHGAFARSLESTKLKSKSAFSITIARCHYTETERTETETEALSASHLILRPNPHRCQLFAVGRIIGEREQ
jgi:hypothetical protein